MKNSPPSRLAFTFLIVLALLLAACRAAAPVETPAPTSLPQATPSPVPAAGSLLVFADASLAEPFEALALEFKAQYPGVEVEFTFAGSQLLADQLVQGAAADVFASDSPAPVQAVIESGRIRAGSEQFFANNRLVVAVPAANPAQISSLADLAVAGRRLSMPAADTPAGQAVRAFLALASQNALLSPQYADQVLANVTAYESDTRLVLRNAVTAEADAGFVYLSDVSGQFAGNLYQLVIPPELNVVAEYVVAPVNSSQQADLANAFIELVQSQSGQDTLARFGFAVLR